jgi:hypothetical protein
MTVKFKKKGRNGDLSVASAFGNIATTRLVPIKEKPQPARR